MHLVHESRTSAATDAAPRHARATRRFWHDEKRFRGSGDASLAQHALLAAGGTRVGGHAKGAPSQGLMGWQVPDRCAQQQGRHASTAAACMRPL